MEPEAKKQTPSDWSVKIRDRLNALIEELISTNDREGHIMACCIALSVEELEKWMYDGTMTPSVAPFKPGTQFKLPKVSVPLPPPPPMPSQKMPKRMSDAESDWEWNAIVEKARYEYEKRKEELDEEELDEEERKRNRGWGKKPFVPSTIYTGTNALGDEELREKALQGKAVARVKARMMAEAVADAKAERSGIDPDNPTNDSLNDDYIPF